MINGMINGIPSMQEGDMMPTCPDCERDRAILRAAWQRIRGDSTVVPSAKDAWILDGLAEILEQIHQRHV